MSIALTVFYKVNAYFSRMSIPNLTEFVLHTTSVQLMPCQFHVSLYSTKSNGWQNEGSRMKGGSASFAPEHVNYTRLSDGINGKHGTEKERGRGEGGDGTS